LQQSGNTVPGVAIQLLVGIEHQNPIGGHRCQGSIAGLGEVIFPRRRNHRGSKLMGDLDRVVGGAGIRDYDLAYNSTHALKAGTQRIRPILHDHRETNCRHCHRPDEN
jgi:hypothetical protein